MDGQETGEPVPPRPPETGRYKGPTPTSTDHLPVPVGTVTRRLGRRSTSAGSPVGEAEAGGVDAGTPTPIGRDRNAPFPGPP